MSALNLVYDHSATINLSEFVYIFNDNAPVVTDHAYTVAALEQQIHDLYTNFSNNFWVDVNNKYIPTQYGNDVTETQYPIFDSTDYNLIDLCIILIRLTMKRNISKTVYYPWNYPSAEAFYNIIHYVIISRLHFGEPTIKNFYVDEIKDILYDYL